MQTRAPRTFFALPPHLALSARKSLTALELAASTVESGVSTPTRRTAELEKEPR
jgi:hypothetical protein